LGLEGGEELLFEQIIPSRS